VPVYVQPLAASHGHLVVYAHHVAFLYEMHVLHAEAVAASQDRAGVVFLENILEHHAYVSRAFFEYCEQARFALRGDELLEVTDQFAGVHL
jgi:hypothetical protein